MPGGGPPAGAAPRLVDTQAIKCIAVRGPRGFDAGKRVLGRKRVALVDAEGHRLTVAVVPASVQDPDALPALDAGKARWPSLREGVHDGAFAADRCREWSNLHGMRHRVVTRDPAAPGLVALARRRVVERSFGWLSHWGGLARDRAGRLDVSAGRLALTAILSGRRGPPQPLADAQGRKLNRLKQALSTDDTAAWVRSHGWTNGSPFDVGWLADHVLFPAGDAPAGGAMALRLDDVRSSGKRYSSGEYRTKDRVLYGTVGARIKAARGSGLVTSLFTYTGSAYDHDPWHEIDIEILGRDTTRMQVNYFTDGVGGHETTISLGFDASPGYHDYAFRWEPGSITWYVDGREVHRATGARGPLPTACFLPIHVYEAVTGKPVAVILRSGKTPDGAEVALVPRHVIRAIRVRWPKVDILVRGDSHYGRPEAIAWCERNGVGYVFGLAGNRVLLKRVASDRTRKRPASVLDIDGQSAGSATGARLGRLNAPELLPTRMVKLGV